MITEYQQERAGARSTLANYSMDLVQERPSRLLRSYSRLFCGCLLPSRSPSSPRNGSPTTVVNVRSNAAAAAAAGGGLRSGGGGGGAAAAATAASHNNNSNANNGSHGGAAEEGGDFATAPAPKQHLRLANKSANVPHIN